MSILKQIEFYLKIDDLDYQKQVYLAFKDDYRIKRKSLKQGEIPNLSKYIDFLLKRIKKENGFNKRKTILSKLEKLTKAFSQINYYNKHISKNKQQNLNMAKFISSIISNYQKRITYTHQYHIYQMKLKKQKEYTMLTFFLKSLSDIKTNIKHLSDIRQIIIDTLREFFKYRKLEFNYMAIPEISKSNHPHLHIFIYHQISKEDIELLEQRISKKLKHLIKEFDMKFSSIKIDNKDNYSSALNNILNKMGNSIKTNKVLYFLFAKEFGRRRFITNSHIKYSFYKLKRLMKIFYKTKVFEYTRISYFKLLKLLEQNDTKIQIKVCFQGMMTLNQFLDEYFLFSNLVKGVQIEDTFLKIR